jgi:hypothetical protein
MPEREDLREVIEKNLTKGAAFYWNPAFDIESNKEAIRKTAEIYKADSFKIPRWEDMGSRWEVCVP